MTIDLRYILPFVAFYVPGAMFAFGAWLLGYQWHEAREFVAISGGLFGIPSFAAVVIVAVQSAPLLVRIGGKGGEE